MLYSHSEALYIYTQRRPKDTPQERLTHTHPHNAADVYTYYNDALYSNTVTPYAHSVLRAKFGRKNFRNIAILELGELQTKGHS